MQHAWIDVERPGGSHTALEGKKTISKAGVNFHVFHDFHASGCEFRVFTLFTVQDVNFHAFCDFCACFLCVLFFVFVFGVVVALVSLCFVSGLLMNVTVHRTMYRSSTSLLLRPLQFWPLSELIN